MTTRLYCENSECRSSTSKLFSCSECHRLVCEGCWQHGHHERSNPQPCAATQSRVSVSWAPTASAAGRFPT